MVYKWYINNNYKLLVKTQMFLTMDMYVMTFNNPNNEFFYNKITNDLFTNEQDIDLMNYYYNPVKMLDVVTSLDKKTQSTFNIGFKQYNKINIDSHNHLYNMNFPINIKDVFIIQIKRFDKDNYIVPVAIKVDNEYLLNNNHILNLEEMFQEINNTSQLTTLLNNFKKTIFV